MKNFINVTNRQYLVTNKKYHSQIRNICIIILAVPIIALVISFINKIIANSNVQPIPGPVITPIAEQEPAESSSTTPSQYGVSTSTPVSTKTTPSDLYNTSLATSTQYRVTRVVDGDTLYIDGLDKRVRLIGVNTPETKHPTKPVQCFGPEASNYLETLLTNQMVTLESDPSTGDIDIYNRYLRYVYLNSSNINYKILYEGYGLEDDYSNDYKYKTNFVAAESDAKSHLRGLWSPSTCNGNL